MRRPGPTYNVCLTGKVKHRLLGTPSGCCSAMNMRWLVLVVLILCSNVSCTQMGLKRLKWNQDGNGTMIEAELLPHDPLDIDVELMGP